MEKYGFVYIWFDRRRKMYYVGCHWGGEDDGYICSSKRMRMAYSRRKEDFKRRIVERTETREELFKKEFRWLSMIKDEELKVRYYNLQKWHYNHWTLNQNPRSTLDKISSSIKQKYDTNPEYRTKVGNARKGKKFYNNGIVERGFKDDEVPEGFVLGRLPGNGAGWNKGIPRTEEQRKSHSEKVKGKPAWNKGISKYSSEEERKKERNKRNRMKYAKKL